ncbi:DUF4292 domain-containing protein [Rubricoccus marinus]|uniref:DUF4292 domain-containing protein n=1 Tax=Rubricoccus marinus TaxID=716817 RepID=A0A259TY17_9BACT|nr:DUF4292 domain-containing protein [Rubricoccus marinus]OZC02601.1 hypothetical protein BSZ36_06200 [Rubricoccus marinus]
MRFALLLLTALSLAACSSGPLVDDAPEGQLPDAYPYQTAAQIRDAIQRSTQPVAFYAADGRIEITTRTLDQKATYSIRARLADSTTVTVRGPLGIEGGRGLITPQSFVAYDKINGKLFVGDIEVADRYVPGAGSSEVLAQSLAGLLAPEAGMDWTVTPDSGRYILVHRRPDRTRRVLVVDPSLWRVVQAQELDASNTVVADQRFSAFDTVDGVVMPRRVVLTAPGEGVRIQLEHNRLLVNPSDFRLRFARPTGVEVIEID